MAEQTTKRKRTLEGVVISNKMQSTVRVAVDRTMSHPRYKKVVSKRQVYFAHTDKELNEGDKVTIMESKPYSKNVKWIVK